uniref:Phosphomannomutase n=1 Tax=Leptospirillum ferrodiazotrophum TaxID=412449 RepID=C6HW65_9BACT|nr:MAG: phosphomannomutase [Leptospirillum ferrodiazotrophum]
MINPGIFREYDIRGRAETDLSDPSITAIGLALASLLTERGATTVALGQDVRLTSPRIASTLTETLLSRGISILDIGTVPTPLLYYSLFVLPVSGGVMVTASHNPAPDNGIKMAIGRETIYGGEILTLRDRAIAFEKAPPPPFLGPRGSRTVESVRERYIREIASKMGPLSLFGGRPLRVVVDCGNATAGLLVRDLYEALGVEADYLFEEPDGRFPNHHPDPTIPENLTVLTRTVREKKADLGLAFDGDSDRIGACDGEGKILFGDQLMALFAEDLLKKRPGSRVISEVKASRFLYDRIRELGGIPDMYKAGHSLIKARMKETKAPLAGEMSGHIFFADEYYGYDDALYAGARLMALVARKGRPLAEMVAAFPRTFSTPELRRECPDEKKFAVVERLKERLATRNLEINAIDGIRVEFPDGWGLVRASNTQPALVLRFEGATPSRLSEIRDLLTGELARAMESEGLDPALATRDASHS